MNRFRRSAAFGLASICTLLGAVALAQEPPAAGAPAPITGTVNVTGASPAVVWVHAPDGKTYVVTGPRAADLAAFSENTVVIHGTPRPAPDGRDRSYQVIALERFSLGQGDSWIGKVRVLPNGEGRSKSVLAVGPAGSETQLTIAEFPSESGAAQLARQLDGSTVSLWGSPRDGRFERGAVDFLAKGKIRTVEGGYEIDLLNGHELTVAAAADASMPVIGTEFTEPRWIMLHPSPEGLAVRWSSLPVVDRRYADPFEEPHLWQILDATWQESVAARVIEFSERLNQGAGAGGLGVEADRRAAPVVAPREDESGTGPEFGRQN